MKKYNHKKIEKKWQKYWLETNASKIDKDDKRKEKFYILDMFPYPSGTGLHMGHTESYAASDVIYRFKKLQGFNVLHPQGFDSFGLPAENYAIKTGISPAITTKENMANYIRQMQSLGFAYDFSQQVVTSSPEYYKWTQWIFGEFFKAGLVYKKTTKTNWCDSCQTVIANEQVVEGKCERCGTEIEQREVPSWFFKITEFAQELIDDLDKIDWPEYTKKNQRNWIGRSEGAVVKFQIKNEKLQTNSKLKNSNNQNSIEVFTTRVDTIFGCTYLVVAPEHEIMKQVQDNISNYEEVKEYLERAKNKTEMERMEAKEKTGVKIEGLTAINPFNNEEVPIFVADYVIGSYGTGAVMAVPAHDERDWEFAKKYNLPIRQSIATFFKGEGKDVTREEKKTVKRRTVFVIIKHWEKDEYIYLNWEKLNWKSFIVGGVNDGENSEEAAIREAKEETGYQNIKSVQKIGGEIHCNFFAEHKDVNRYGICEGFYIELKDGNFTEPEIEHTKNHKAIWVNREEVSKTINLKNNLWYWDIYLNGNKATTEDGILTESGEFSGLSSQEAREKMIAWLEENKLGERKINYRLRDWSISRQRYWGCPIPIAYSPDGEAHLVPKEHLPWKLPEDVDFVPTGVSPLAKSEELKKRVENIFGKGWVAEYDTMDTFVDSSWYFLRYPDANNDKEFCSSDRLKQWLPVNIYIGGAEHTYMHLLFARFFTKAMHKIGILDFDEPFLKLRHQGMVLDKKGDKMSKSKGNVINPDDMIERFGADSVRTYMLFVAPLEDAVMWNEDNIVGITRFIEKVWKIFVEKELIDCGGSCEGIEKELPILLHKTIKKVTQDIETLNFNTAISQLMIFVNGALRHNKLPKAGMESFLILLSPFAPHIAEEIWSEILGHNKSIFLEKWPKFNEAMTKDAEIEIVIQVNGKVRDKVLIDANISEAEISKIVVEREKIENNIRGKEIKKIIYVKGRLVSIVV